eukprot:TRINITY_DN16646_c0_g1_i1.p1 TRINITY_DN16646_c0_g1~~TRINITY_DN16646_c0_g1_i1.p1  ORF type:complete len:476 (-),score=95.65 TRINITY_DN16646_c0_g1_i1:133-1560(-)
MSRGVPVISGPTGLLEVSVPSAGSVLHASGACRPCVGFWKPKGCLQGGRCEYCHLCPEGELDTQKKMKSRRRKFQDFTSAVMEEAPTSVPSSAGASPRGSLIFASAFEAPGHLSLRSSTSDDDAGATTPRLPTEELALPSVGSSHHGSRRCKPCAWFWKAAGCQNGFECEHCHLCSASELKMRKRERLLRKVSTETVWRGDEPCENRTEESADVGSVGLIAAAVASGNLVPLVAQKTAQSCPVGYIPVLVQVKVPVPVAPRHDLLEVLSAEAFTRREPPEFYQAEYIVPDTVQRTSTRDEGEGDPDASDVVASSRVESAELPLPDLPDPEWCRPAGIPPVSFLDPCRICGEYFFCTCHPSDADLVLPRTKAEDIEQMRMFQTLQLEMQRNVALDDDEDKAISNAALHAEGRCHPCCWFHKPQGCYLGKDCSYCHTCPAGELKARKKLKFRKLADRSRGGQHDASSSKVLCLDRML